MVTVHIEKIEAAKKRNLISSVLISLRPYQWIKNTLVFSALLFSLSLFKWDLVFVSALAFAIFCLASSGVYLFNDLIDYEEDRHHPAKRLRPIASGSLNKSLASILMMILMTGAIFSSLLINISFTIIIIAYILMNIAYTIKLKHVIILDVIIVSMGFVLRAAAGAYAINMSISSWLFLCTLLLAIFVSLGKRRHEIILLKEEAGQHRDILGEYSVSFLDLLMAMTGGIAIIAYALYTMADETVNRFETTGLILTTPMVLYGVSRYFFLVMRCNSGGDPAKLIATDIPTIINIAVWIISSGLILYVFK